MIQYLVYGFIVICIGMAIFVSLKKPQVQRYSLQKTRITDPAKSQFIRFGKAMYCSTDDILHEGEVCPICGRSNSFNLIVDILSAKELQQQKKVPKYMFNFKSRAV